jgi:hypothetical protein
MTLAAFHLTSIAALRKSVFTLAMNLRPYGKAIAVAFLLPAILPLASAPLRGAVITVPATASIYKSGGNSSPYNGNDPPFISFSPSTVTAVRFTNVSGTVSYNGIGFIGPDGDPNSQGDDPSVGGLSGLLNDTNFPFVGVFTDDNVPAPPAPARLDFTGHRDFTSLSPLLNQVFYIGDGLTGTGSGTVQNFVPPASATHLYLGFLDNQYADNLGQLTATISVIPEPSSFVLSAIGTLGLILTLAARRKANNKVSCA